MGSEVRSIGMNLGASRIRLFLMIGGFGITLGLTAGSDSSTPEQANAADGAAVAAAISKRGFFKDLLQAYIDDWKGTSSGEEPKFRGYPAAVSNPPFPFLQCGPSVARRG